VASVVPPTPPSNSSSRAPSREVLLVDDDEDIREIVSEILCDHGHRVRVAVNGREALRALDEMAAPPALVLLDLMMPEIDGAQFLAILEEHPVHSGIPVVVVTASRKTAPESVRHRVAGWLPKPVEYDHLVAMVGHFVDSDGVGPSPLAPVVPIGSGRGPRASQPIPPMAPLPTSRTRDVTRFLERRVGELELLRRALAAADHLEIRRIGHNLKGVGTSFGFPEFTELGGRLESAARNADEPALRALIDEMTAVVSRVRAPAPPAGDPPHPL
jgi:CheY-like chemotaxis protein